MNIYRKDKRGKGMFTEHIYLQEERKYAAERFVFWAIATILAFVLSGMGDETIAREMLMAGFILLIVDLVGILYYYFMTYMPDTAIFPRKVFLILLDIGVISYLIHIFGHYGIYLFSLYTVIVLRSGASFGIAYFYIALAAAMAGMAALAAYSPYWSLHIDIVAAFALATMIVPFFSLHYLIETHRENHEFEEMLEETEVDDMHDALTGVLNRKGYKERMQTLLHEKRPFSLLFLDVNKFKAINENYGNDVGDQVLKEVARRISEYLEGDDALARLGADEFALITTRNKVYLDKLLAKLERNVTGRFKTGKTIVPIELNIGVSLYPEDAQSAMMLGKYADIALFAAQRDDERYHYFYHELSSEQKEEFMNR
jgi:diguanylate cyclase (GGDEF)-like protein